MLRAFEVCNVCINLLAIIANAFGICWIIKFRKPYSNQIKIIGSISFSDIILSTLSLTMTLLPSKLGYIHLHVYLIRASLYVSWFLMFFLLMIDRFCCCCFPFWYKRYVSPNCSRNCLCGCWAISISLAPIVCNIQPFDMQNIFNRFAWIIFDCIFLCLFLCLYGAIFVFKHRSGTRTGRKTRFSETLHFLRVTSTMLTVFVLFEIIPSLTSSIMHLADFKQARTISRYFELLWATNLLADPIIYIFTQPNAIRDLSISVRSICGRFNRDTTANIVSPNKSRPKVEV